MDLPFLVFVKIKKEMCEISLRDVLLKIRHVDKVKVVCDKSDIATLLITDNEALNNLKNAIGSECHIENEIYHQTT